jgi:RNA polymerase sigma factor for flagellar operon FliA
MAQRLGLDLLAFQQLLGELHGLDLGTLQADNSEDFEETAAEATHQPSGPEENPFFQCLQAELKAFLTEALKSLAEKERQVVALYYLEELTMKEVGAVLGIGESRVSQLHSLALLRLRARLQELMQSRAPQPHEAPPEEKQAQLEQLS